MAARTSVGVGLGVTVTLLGVAALGLFISTVIFLSQKQAAERKYNELNADAARYVTDAERASDVIGQIRQTAGGQSVVGYLHESLRGLKRRVAGDENIALDDLNARLDTISGGRTGHLTRLIAERDERIAALTKDVETARSDRMLALADKEAEVARVAAIEEGFRNEVASLQAQLDEYARDVEANRGDINDSKQQMEERVSRIQQEARDNEVELQTRIRDLERDLVLKQDLLARLQAELRGRSYKAEDEYALVDAEIIATDSTAGTVTINRGRRERIPLGITFEVYSDASGIRPDSATGEYPAGKSSVEVIRVDEATSLCRVVREKRGNPAVRGDVAANAVYDPSKVYKVLVYGNFDTDGDGRATQQEQFNLRAQLEDWGAKVVDELTGDVDFVVLGQKPALGVPPQAGAPVELVSEYVRQKKIVQQYDDLFRQSTSASIPVLSENRLYTLIGKGSGG